ncbi:MAG: hypothetical protein ABS81_02440 [Pseudonocardia sp. SCN 72-86]|nr:MAG: hypothetical protein ABS81_02440 [Pseudonocardia sp. SCN 72-86]
MSTDDHLVLDLVSSGYGRIGILDEVSLVVPRGALVVVVGSNGAGKSTMLKTISGVLPATSGTITVDGRDVTRSTPAAVVAAGIVQVAEGRRLFRTQTVAENLDLGLYGTRLHRKDERERLDHVLTTFPELVPKLGALAGALSGGQQQMLAVGQALMARPRLLMLDEPSIGLAPVVVDSLFDVFTALRSEGVTIVLVEQEVERALDLADHAYVMQGGRVIGGGSPDEVRSGDLIARAYLGAGAQQQNDVAASRDGGPGQGPA